MEEIITVTRTVTQGKHTITATLTATPAQIQAGALALAHLGMKPECGKCGDKLGDSKS